MTTNEGAVSKNEWRALEVECSYSALEPAARGFFSGFTGVALRWRFFSRRLLLLLRAGISSLRHETTRHELSRSPTLHRILIHWPSYPGSTLMARDRTMTEVKSEIVLSIIISILARCVRGTASVGLEAVAVLYPR